MEALNIALIGCGTVGSGVARLLLEHPERLAARAGRMLTLRHIVVRNPDRPRLVELPREVITTDIRKVLADADVHVAVEVVGGTDYARCAILDLLAAGKHVVTANKALLAQHGAELFDAGRRHNRAIAFEAAVAGGVPIVAGLTQNLAANQITGILGILNGTSNFILTGMSEDGRSYAEALAEAQKRGYAEADPTLDVDGTDAAHKLAILAQIAFGVAVPLEKIDRVGVSHIQQADIKYAQQLGYTIKLLAEAWLQEGELALHVAPVLLRHQVPLAQVRGTYNAIQVVGDAVGDTLFYGKGAGQMPTASAVVGDIIDMAVGRAQRTFQTLRLWSRNNDTIRFRPKSTVPSRFYLRLLVEDRPGVLGEVAQILGQHQIGIRSVMQHEPIDEAAATLPLIIMTHQAPTGVFQRAVAEIEELPSVLAPAVYFSVAD